uniref:PDZ GRASP-type domain-containing protein n=1 Tax=Aplanochytrium stocchinoi TaxID=215587 RepID=A0A7S3PNA2_9STRA|mmetsp:Transcript_11728/g.14618  ORF Transcript_11728/g.14618 Transcript_11728/m.14618 type:complete len:360 (-) Transcript_11728:76-1155(-)
MGNADSDLSSTELEVIEEAAAEILTKRPYGHRILGIQENSPCSYETIKQDIVPFFDFIVEANGVSCDKDDGSFVQIIQDCVRQKKELNLKIFNIKNKQIRTISCQPNMDWGGEGALGLTIKFDFIADIQDHCIHVLDVTNHSPAEKAGLDPYNDYILGTPHYVMRDSDDLNELVSENMDTMIELFVYSQTNDEVRRVEIIPSLQWFDSNANPVTSKGSLGCGVGHGYLHRLPTKTLHSTGKGRVEDYLTLTTKGKNKESKSTSHTDSPENDPDAETSGNNNGVNVSDVLHEVNTPLGKGEIHGERGLNKSIVVKLDWGLDHNATAMALFKKDHVSLIPHEAEKEEKSKVVSVDIDISPQ